MNAHFIDLDIILKTDAKPWIIDKNNPNIPIMKIEIDDFNLFKSGILKSQGNKISFNGKTFWLSNEFMNKLKVKCKRNKLDISNIGISLQEFLNPEVSENLKFDLNLSIFNPVINTNDHIYVICSKNTKTNFEKQISKFEEKLAEIGLKVEKYYYISETFYNRNDDELAYIKSKLILQHILGLKTEGDKISEIEITDYNQITFYDDNQKSIQTVKDINKILEKLLINTDKDVKLKVKDKIKSDDNFILIKEYTHNKSNKFREHSVQLHYSNIIKNFEGFRIFESMDMSKGEIRKIADKLLDNLGRDAGFLNIAKSKDNSEDIKYWLPRAQKSLKEVEECDIDWNKDVVRSVRERKNDLYNMCKKIGLI
jgi:hypothetical protein